MLGICWLIITAKQDYRTYKLVRMEDVCITEDEFSKEHRSAQDILNDCDNSYQGKDISIRVRMRCRGNAIHRIKEYLNGQLIKTVMMVVLLWKFIL